MTKYKLLALDLDGTTLTTEKNISQQTKLWISRAKQSGVKVIFSTGRSLQGVEEFRNVLNLNTPLVLANGGEIWKQYGEILERNFILADDIEKLYHFAKEINANFVAYNGKQTIDSNQWNESMFHKNWITFSMIHNDINVIHQVKEHFKQSKTLEVTSSHDTNLEFSLKGISKEYGVRKVCKLLNIKMQDVMAIGDNLNDLSLLTAAGLGIAMGNANEKVKKMADRVTTTNNEDGVAKAIERYLLNECIYK